MFGFCERMNPMNNGMQIFDYEDIQMIPNKCVVRSRKEVDTSVKFGPHTFKIPIVPANSRPSLMNLWRSGWPNTITSILCIAFSQSGAWILSAT